MPTEQIYIVTNPHYEHWDQYIIGTSSESLEQIIEQYKDIPNSVVKVIKGCPQGTEEKLRNVFKCSKIIDVSNDFEWVIVENIKTITDFVEQECIRAAYKRRMYCKLYMIVAMGGIALVIILGMLVLVAIMAL